MSSSSSIILLAAMGVGGYLLYQKLSTSADPLYAMNSPQDQGQVPVLKAFAQSNIIGSTLRTGQSATNDVAEMSTRIAEQNDGSLEAEHRQKQFLQISERTMAKQKELEAFRNLAENSGLRINF